MIASDDADYGWLAAAVTRLRQIVTTYDLGWETELHPPATWEVIDAAERAIEIPRGSFWQQTRAGESRL